MPKPSKDPGICSKENCTNPRVSPGSTMPWCQEHKNEYNRQYESGKDWRNQRLGMIRGIRAMREAVAAHFKQWGGRPFMGNEVAALVESLPGPSVAEESAVPMPEAAPEERPIAS